MSRSNPELEGESSKPDRLLLFANARSGGGAAKTIMSIFSKAIGPSRVFDLSQHNPYEVLLNEFENSPSPATSSPPRIIVAGGDGTVTWILSIIATLSAAFPTRLPPPVAILPLGTGNDLAINLGWGKTFHAGNLRDSKLRKMQTTFCNASVTQLDYWNVEFSGFCFSDVSGLPHALRRDPSSPTSASSKFWNYFSIGLDAQSAYNFHLLREHHPRFTSSRLVNQAWYGVFTCGTGWFCGGRPLVRSTLSPVGDGIDVDVSKSIIKTLRIKKTLDGDYVTVPVPNDIRAIILLNLQTYGGGRDIWGMNNERNLERKSMQRPRYNDGLIEAIGFRNGWHTAVVMGEVASQKVHGKRLGQGCAVELTLASSTAGVTTGTCTGPPRAKSVCMQIDGEPWKQPLTVVDDTGDIEGRPTAPRQSKITVSLGGKSTMLCRTSPV